MLVPLPALKLNALFSVMVSVCPLGTVISGGCQPLPLCGCPLAAAQETPVPETAPHEYPHIGTFCPSAKV
ncbi:MAG TPA: hypothetical protein VFF82_05375, partial [Rhodocyclaceae bacterium]|nr:hypothetical protein [Rhodocyclaceae bacterium]